jgi:tricarballylate dehydrogenase
MATFRVGADDRLDPFWVGTMQEVSKGLADAEYCRTFEREVPRTIALLREIGIELISNHAQVANEMNDHTVLPNGGGRAIIDTIARSLEETPGVEFHYETEAVRLSLDDEGLVAGIVVRTADGRLTTLAADNVVLACGGFEGNKTMLTQFVGPNACDLQLIAPGVAFNKGAGIRMGMEIGADTAGQFDMIHSELVDHRTSRADAVIYGHNYGIVVNGKGERFMDEGEKTLDASFELIAYEVWRNQGQTAFFIADQTMASVPHLMALNDTDMPPIEAETIADLADQLGLEPDALEKTIADYNAAIGPGEFNPAILDGKSTQGLIPPKSNWAYPLSNPPYFAFPLTTAITFTYGGLKADVHGRVIATNGKPIPGLYAAGEIVGLYYHEYPPATSVLRSLTFGRRAGAHIAAQARDKAVA